MIKRLSIIILSVFILFTTSCQSKSVSVEPASAKTAEKIKPVIPFEERKFIYTNGITYKSKETNTIDENGVKVAYNYPVISGLKNKEVQDKLNKEFLEEEKNQLTQLEAKVFSAKTNNKFKLNQKFANSYISYNCNNVIFVNYYANVDARLVGNNYFPTYSSISYGYDLNTGERIKLEDLFKPGSKYKDKINKFISQYLIENNFDDYEYERMSKPFQGIRENQSFSFATDGLIILLDEKNDEFVNYGYNEQVTIPLKYIGDDLYIFDRYFDEGKSIFEKDKLSKKPLPNKLEFKPDKLVREENSKYFISVLQGQFINVPDKAIEKKLNDLVKCSFDIEGFKKKAVDSYVPDRLPSYSYYVVVYTNTGGYLSMGIMENTYIEGKYESNITPYNYDFNLGKELRLEDIFDSSVDIEAEMKKRAIRMNYPISKENLDKAVRAAIKDNKFYFFEYGVNIYLPLEDSKLYNEQKWIYIPFQEIDTDSIKLFK